MREFCWAGVEAGSEKLQNRAQRSVGGANQALGFSSSNHPMCNRGPRCTPPCRECRLGSLLGASHAAAAGRIHLSACLWDLGAHRFALSCPTLAVSAAPRPFGRAPVIERIRTLIARPGNPCNPRLTPQNGMVDTRHYGRKAATPVALFHRHLTHRVGALAFSGAGRRLKDRDRLPSLKNAEVGRTRPVADSTFRSVLPQRPTSVRVFSGEWPRVCLLALRSVDYACGQLGWANRTGESRPIRFGRLKCSL